jgi:hypothetical protein
LTTQQGPVNIKIDKVPPYCNIWDPADRANVPRNGGFWVQATATDDGSGIHYVSFDVGPPYENPVVVYNDDPPGSGNYKWWCDRSYSSNQWRHIIAQAYDYAGHMYESNIYVYFKKVLSQDSVQNNVNALINNNIQIDSDVLLNQQLNGMQNNLILSRVQIKQT